MAGGREPTDRFDKSRKIPAAASSSSAASIGSHAPSATRAASSSGTASRRASVPNASAVTSSRARASRRWARSPLDSSHASCLSSAATRSSTPSPVVPTVGTIGGFHSVRARDTMCRRSRRVAWASGRSALFTTRTSATSRRPALAAWTESPMPGTTRTAVVSAAEAISTSAWPTPTVSTRMTS